MKEKEHLPAIDSLCALVENIPGQWLSPNILPFVIKVSFISTTYVTWGVLGTMGLNFLHMHQLTESFAVLFL